MLGRTLSGSALSGWNFSESSNIVGAINVTLGSVEIDATGLNTGFISGTILSTLSNIVSAITGVLPIVGTLSSTLGDIVSTATGRIPVTGTVAVELSSIISTASGSFGVYGGSSNEKNIEYFRLVTGLSSYNYNELAIAYYKQMSGTPDNDFNETQRAAQTTVGFIGTSPLDWRNL